MNNEKNNNFWPWLIFTVEMTRYEWAKPKKKQKKTQNKKNSKTFVLTAQNENLAWQKAINVQDIYVSSIGKTLCENKSHHVSNMRSCWDFAMSSDWEYTTMEFHLKCQKKNSKKFNLFSSKLVSCSFFPKNIAKCWSKYFFCIQIW